MSVNEMVKLDNTIKILIASEFAEQISSQLTNDHNIDDERIILLSAQDIKRFSIGLTEATRKTANSLLLVISDILHRAKIHHHIDAGTLLGIIRDGDLIPWDDDLDFAVPDFDIVNLQRLFPEICESLQKLTGVPWKVDTLISETAFNNVPKSAIRGFKLRTDAPSSIFPMTDFFIKYLGDGWMDYTLASRGFRMPSRHMLNTTTTRFKEGLLTIPSDVERYLERHYGDWKTPNSNWNLSELKNATVFEGKSR